MNDLADMFRDMITRGDIPKELKQPPKSNVAPYNDKPHKHEDLRMQMRQLDLSKDVDRNGQPLYSYPKGKYLADTVSKLGGRKLRVATMCR